MLLFSIDSSFLYIFIAMKTVVLLIAVMSNILVLSQGFKKVPENQSGIHFVNEVIETEKLNGLTYLYLYNGGGVAVGDVNNDGLEDLYFTGNQVDDKLYLNKGDLEFKDVTDKYFKKCKSNTFHTGVTMVDINNDGWLDIYVSVAGPSYVGSERANLLYINNKGKGFSEQAEQYGLADTLNTTQTVFFDYDLDGDLDCYMLNHVKLNSNVQEKFPTIDANYNIQGDDHFYVNENGKYIEKSEELGLVSTRYGLGVVVSDLNNDGYPDVYVTNDFNYPDKMFINQKDGSFRDEIKEKTGHCSVYAMGVDAADFNNDGLFDLMTVDMASEDHVRSKKNMGAMSTKAFWNEIRTGKHYQYMYNSLQLNQGNGMFSEMAQMAGVSKTDWSWAPLISDFDNDGYQDLFISNGYIKDIRDNDFKIKYENEIKYSNDYKTFKDVNELIPVTKLSNYIYKNNKDLTFSKMNFEWGMSELINANGAVYSDLDNDGDMDLVLNATSVKSFIMENISNNSNGFLDVKLSGMPGNIACLGAKIEIVCKDLRQSRELQTVKGFQSSVTSKVHFGVGVSNVVDTLIVTWNNKEQTILTNIDPNQVLKISYNSAIKVEKKNKKQNTFFKEVSIDGLSNYVHEEFAVNDFNEEVLLPHKMSELGPFVTVEDINNDGLEDVFIGGARAYASKMYFQNKEGDFELQKQIEIEKDKNFEDMQSVFFDFDNDGDKDLYVVSGGNESPINHASLGDRLYINSNGVFEKTDSVLPGIRVSGQKVLAKDINNDGWVDLIVFGRQVPKAYPKTPKTSVLMNKNGLFTNEVKTMAPDLELVGMVTDAIFTDYDNDGDDDIIVVGEWMAITVFENNNNYFTNITDQLELDKTIGWWSAIKEITVNGSKKYVLGNIGKNNKYHPSTSKTLQIYMDDFDGNGTNDIVLAKKQGDICYPLRGRQCSSEQMSFIVDKFPTYTDYATADLTSIYSEEKLNNSISFKATIFENSILSFEGNEVKFEVVPNELQLGCVNSIVEVDFNNDGNLDYLLLGNKYEAEVETIRYDANLGIGLLGGDNLSIVTPKELGFYLNSNTKSAEMISVKGVDYVLVLSSREGVKILKTL
jgi:hypothetical protein